MVWPPRFGGTSFFFFFFISKKRLTVRIPPARPRPYPAWASHRRVLGLEQEGERREDGLKAEEAAGEKSTMMKKEESSIDAIVPPPTPSLTSTPTLFLFWSQMPPPPTHPPTAKKKQPNHARPQPRGHPRRHRLQRKPLLRARDPGRAVRQAPVGRLRRARLPPRPGPDVGPRRVARLAAQHHRRRAVAQPGRVRQQVRVVAAAQGFLVQHGSRLPSQGPLEQPGAEELEKGLDVGRGQPVERKGSSRLPLFLFPLPLYFNLFAGLRDPLVAALVGGRERGSRDQDQTTNF